MFQQDGSYAIASELNEAIAMGDWRAYPTYVDRLAEVTPADIQRVAQTYLVSHRATVGRYIPEVYPTAPAEIEHTEEVTL
jgi:zinc protease